MTPKLNIVVLGSGRMGGEIVACIGQSNDLHLSGVWSRSQQTRQLSSLLVEADVAIDFTLPAATEEVIRAAVETRTPLVCGVSGLPEAVHQAMIRAGNSIPLLYDRNMSLGIAVMRRLVQIAGATLGNRFETEIHETHHVHKIDAPSGTALMLGEDLAASLGRDFSESFHYDPDGRSQAKNDQIAFYVERLGEVKGEHRVVFKNDSEELSLEHKVSERRVFAEGAIKAARWLVGQPAGFYSMQDLVSRKS
jgi:4-hydroxy-tetrahydrodipicolinate reductase